MAARRLRLKEVTDMNGMLTLNRKRHIKMSWSPYCAKFNIRFSDKECICLSEDGGRGNLRKIHISHPDGDV
jgi:hypothetical protein